MDSLLRSEALRNRQKQMLHPLAKWQGDSVSKKWQMPLFRGSKFGQPEVARICKELILQAKSTTREAGKAGLHEEKSEGLRPLRHLLKVF